MSDEIERSIEEIVGEAGDAGIAMGALVDRLVRAGAREVDLEAAVWSLLQQRRLTPNGFVRRRLRVRDGDGKPASARTYEFTLVRWSPDLDAAGDAADTSDDA